MTAYNIDEQTGLWITSLTPIGIYAAGKPLQKHKIFLIFYFVYIQILSVLFS